MLFLEDLMKKGNVRQAVNEQIQPFRQQFGLSQVDQLGVVVPDVEASARDLESKGCGSFLIASGSASMWQEFGKEHHMVSKLGIAYYQGIEVELLEPGQGSDFYRQNLDPDGKPVVQHLGFQVDDVDDWAGKLQKEGYKLWVRGQIKQGPSASDFAYMDTVDQTGLIIEFISHRLFGIHHRPPVSFFHAVGRLQRITGKRCFYTN